MSADPVTMFMVTAAKTVYDIKESKKIYKHNIIKELPEIIKYHLTLF